MVVYFLMHILMIAILASPGVLYAKHKQTWCAWDIFLTFIPIAIWFILISRGIGAQSAGNLMELKILAVGIPLLFSLRVFILDRFLTNHKKNSLYMFLACSLLPIGLRFFMPEISLDPGVQ